ncbi:MAG TPA: hypothetical protein VN414_00940 [Methanosarcina sp.]|nr:hypothetical protein [Methanosarcina sp.]
MDKTNSLKVMPRLLGMLLCLALIQAACAQTEQFDGNLVFGNVTYENGTYENATLDTGFIDGNVTCENVTVHTINPTSLSMYLVAGNSEKFTVSFKNEGNETLVITPKVVSTSNNGNDIIESWIVVSTTNATVEPGALQEFTVEVNVPRDAESANYQAAIAFTDDLFPDSTEYVNSMKLDLLVQASPKIELQASYISDTVKAGQEYEYRMKIKNVADKDITIDPKVNRYTYDNSLDTFDISDDAIIISAPSVIKAGEIASMTIKVPVPENATGSYNGYIDMNVDGKANDGSNPQIGLYFRAMQQPTVPYVKIFNTTTTAPIAIDVSTDTYDPAMGLRISPKNEEPSFEVKLKYNSRFVSIYPTKITQSSNVNTGEYYFPAWALDNSTIYQNTSKHYVETYTISGAIGTWELQIMPKNTESFGYSIMLENQDKNQHILK